MSLSGWLEGIRRPWRRPDLDPEARRAHEALLRVRDMKASRRAQPEWHDLARRRRHRRIRTALATVCVAALGLGVAAGAWFGGRYGFAWLRGHTDLFRVQEVIVTGTARMTPGEVCAASGVARGQDILSVNCDSVTARLLTLPEVRMARTRRTMNRQVILDVIERRAVALVELEQLHEIDEEGVVLPSDSSGAPLDLPIINGVGGGPVPPGSRVQAAGLRPAIDLVLQLSRPEIGMASEVSNINAARPDSLIVRFMGRSYPVKVGDGNVPLRRLAALRAALDDIARQKMDVEYVDLRFRGQVAVMPIPAGDDPTSVTPAMAPRMPAALSKPDLHKKATVQKKAPAVKHGGGRKGRRSRHGLNT